MDDAVACPSCLNTAKALTTDSQGDDEVPVGTVGEALERGLQHASTIAPQPSRSSPASAPDYPSRGIRLLVSSKPLRSASPGD